MEVLVSHLGPDKSSEPYQNYYRTFSNSIKTLQTFQDSIRTLQDFERNSQDMIRTLQELLTINKQIQQGLIRSPAALARSSLSKGHSIDQLYINMMKQPNLNTQKSN